jgi:hypothetical protein
MYTISQNCHNNLQAQITIIVWKDDRYIGEFDGYFLDDNQNVFVATINNLDTYFVKHRHYLYESTLKLKACIKENDKLPSFSKERQQV